MFVVIADIMLKKDKVSEFKQWFSESNKTISKFDGFISRQVLESGDDTHRILVEFQNRELFEKMHKSPEHAKLHGVAVTYMETPPIPKFYNVVAN